MNKWLVGAGWFSLIWLAAGAFGAEGPNARPTTLPVYKLKIPHTTAEYELIKLPAGTVQVPGVKPGSPPTDVEVKPIWMGRTEVTWDCYDVYAYALDLTTMERQRARAPLADGGSRPTHPYGPPDRGFGHEEHPVITAHPAAIERYCKWLSEKTGRTFRLPTEAEWIYACRAGSSRDITDLEELKEVAWFHDNADKTTMKVGRAKPNAWGLYDMLGNAAEFVQPYASPRNADKEWFVKGGAYQSPAKLVNSVYRDYMNDDWQLRDPADPKSTWWLVDAPFAGFRIVMEDQPERPAAK